MSEILKIYSQFYGDIILTIIRIVIGMVMILNTKKISKNFKCRVVAVYYGIILEIVVLVGIKNVTLKLALCLLVVFSFGFAIIKCYKIDCLMNSILLFVYSYMIIGCIVEIIDINFSELLGNYNYDIDYTSICVTMLLAGLLSAFVYMIICRKKDTIFRFEANKYFWLGNYFVVSAFVGFSIFPIYGPGDGREMILVLLNVSDDFKTNFILLFETLLVFLYRGYKNVDLK